MHVFRPSLFDLLDDSITRTEEGCTVLLTPVLQELANNDKYLALEMKGNRYDTSKKLGLLQAQLALGLAGDIKEELLSATRGSNIRIAVLTSINCTTGYDHRPQSPCHGIKQGYESNRNHGHDRRNLEAGGNEDANGHNFQAFVNQ